LQWTAAEAANYFVVRFVIGFGLTLTIEAPTPGGHKPLLRLPRPRHARN
jgi:hypothetical protein